MLVDDKGSKGGGFPVVFKTASVREDLFSKKQIKKLVELSGENADCEASPPASVANDESTEIAATISETTNSVTRDDPPYQTALKPRDASNFETPAVLVTPTFSPSLDSVLLNFLKAHDSCLKGSPSDFGDWLYESEDINTLEDLAVAVADEEYLRNVLQNGDGTVGVKSFKRSHFKKAVLAVAGSFTSAEEDKENVEYPPELLCPISHVLMRNDPVVASDGHTYERSAIISWIQKQSLDIEEATYLIAAGSTSLQTQAIVERGILSPMTQETMDSLDLFQNKSIRAMARNFAEAQNDKRAGSRP